MKKKSNNKKVSFFPPLCEDELCNSGVGKILLHENGILKKEIDVLKKSLKINQNELEKLRTKNHELDKENTILGYKLTTRILPEFLKFLASSVGAGVAINFFFNNQIKFAIFSLTISIVIYIGILLIYRK
jgi:hypothetical protein